MMGRFAPDEGKRKKLIRQRRKNAGRLCPDASVEKRIRYQQGRISVAYQDNLQMHRSFGGIPIEVNCPG
jgi:hypothetical protein